MSWSNQRRAGVKLAARGAKDDSCSMVVIEKTIESGPALLQRRVLEVEEPIESDWGDRPRLCGQVSRGASIDK